MGDDQKQQQTVFTLPYVFCIKPILINVYIFEINVMGPFIININVVFLWVMNVAFCFLYVNFG